MPYIYYLIRFYEEQVKALLKSNNKINAICFNYAKKLDIKVWHTNVEIQKINDSTIKIFGIVIADFQVEDKASRYKFF